jgi:superfamily II DNA/RNA helicase
MGFIGPVQTIAAKMPSTKQTLMFTATFGKNVRKLSAALLTDPFEIETESAEEKHTNIEQLFIQTDNLSDKQRHLEKILSESKIDQAIIFSSTKMQTRRIAEDLHHQGLLVGALHGDLNQRQRSNTLRQFREGKIKFLVATDVAGRGIDVLTVSHVINFDVPKSLDDYIHRIGRTGRAGNKGIALSFFSHKDWEIRKEIEKFSGVAIPGGSGGGEPRSHQRPQRPRRKAPWQTEKRRFGERGASSYGGGGFRSRAPRDGNNSSGPSPRNDGDRGDYGGGRGRNSYGGGNRSSDGERGGGYGGGRKPSFFNRGPSQKSSRP